jgi:ATP-binding cassette subfamily B multidrug efflux pump
MRHGISEQKINIKVSERINSLKQRRATKDSPLPQKNSIGRAAQYLLNYKGQAALPYFFLVIATLSQLAVPKLIANVINAVTNGVIAKTILDALGKIPTTFMSQALPTILEFLKYPPTWTVEQLAAQLNTTKANAPHDLIVGGIVLVVFGIVFGIFSFLQAYWAEKNSQAVAFDLRNDLFAKIQRLSFSYHDRNQTGQLMIRATDDVEKVRLFIGQGLIQLVGAFILLAGTLIIIFSTNAKLAIVTVWILPVALVLFFVFGSLARPLFTRIQQKLSILNTTLQENMAGIKVIKSFTREKSERAKFGEQADQLMRQQIVVSRVFAFLIPVIFLVANLGQATTLYAGGVQIVHGTLTIGDWQEFSLYLIFMFLPIAQFGFIITQFSQASASATRIFEILDAKSDVTDKPEAVALPTVEGHIKFENVGFRYFGAGDPVLKNVSFDTLPGQVVALLGATGSGKTTIINLLPRFYDPTEGRITIDGHDLRDLSLQSLRAQIGIVLQETTLFLGTIRDNIAFGKPDATEEDIVSAAKAAAAHDFIMEFPDGYDTRVGERGTTLSGGQKQRIAIARALLLSPHILILDDSTSSVDLSTEAQIQEALDKLMKGRTSFVIAQRISTVMNADLILVMDKGEVVARGRHKELMEDSEIYAEIYNSQLVGDVTSDMEVA